MPDIAAIRTTQLDYSYNRHPVLNSVELVVPAGSIFGFLGPNGAGKSTTIKALLGLLHVKPGTIFIFGKELNANRIDILKRTGATVESPSLYEHLSARRNIEITRQLRGISQSRTDEVLDIVGLYSDAQKPVKQFSTGMKQRLSLALALLGEPELLILDEPINGLDPEGIREIRNLLLKLNREKGCTIFLSSHILEEIEKVCSHVAVIHHGRILFQGNAASINPNAHTGGILLLDTSDVQRCRLLLSDSECADTQGNQLRIEYQNKQEAAAIIRKIIEAGIEIYSAIPETFSLEESFFELLRQDNKS